MVNSQNFAVHIELIMRSVFECETVEIDGCNYELEYANANKP